MRFLALSLVASFAFAAQAQQIAPQVQVGPMNRTVAVSATAQAERRADTATVHIGYQLYAATPQAVAEQAGSASRAIAYGVAKTGVPADALESESQSTGPVQEYQTNGRDPAEQARRKFQAQQSWTVRVPAALSAKVLAAAVAAGANQSGAIDWSLADEDALTAEAAGKALKQAQAVAGQMAAGLGAKLGSLVYASNEAQQAGVPVNARSMQGVQEYNGPPRTPEAVKLSLNAPMVRRSATVYAVFALQ